MVESSNIPIQIKGGNPLQGRVRIQGSKNASLPVLAATLLIAGQCTLDNCPQIMDVVCMQKLLEHAGCQVKRTDHRMTVNAPTASTFAHPAVIATRPAREPFKDMDTSGLPFLIQV